MRIAIVDYSGHAFPIQLSRTLAKRGHIVLHSHFSDFQSPHGRLAKSDNDSSNLSVEPISLGYPFHKYSFLRRRFQEIAVGRQFVDRLAKFNPEIVVAGNCPLDVVSRIADEALRSGRKFVFWQQDIYSHAISRILQQKLGVVGYAIGAHYRFIERRILRRSDATIVISKDFVETIRTQLNLSARNVTVIENWAPLDEIPLCEKNNRWAEKHGLIGKEIVLYSGTIGLKHDPQQLLDLAESLREKQNVVLVVVSEGPFAFWLAHQAAIRKLSNVLVLPFQSHRDFPEVLASADVAVAILENDAGTFSVPSKILSYLAAGRAIALSAPRDNLASRIVEGSRSGIAVDAGDRTGFVTAVRKLLSDPHYRKTAGSNARKYAEAAFDIEAIATRFEELFHDIVSERTTFKKLHRLASSTTSRNSAVLSQKTDS